MSNHYDEKAYQEGMNANVEGVRRGQNPYSAGVDQRACLAWWAGWDAEDERAGEEDVDILCPICGTRTGSLDVAKEWEMDHVERWVDHCNHCGWTGEDETIIDIGEDGKRYDQDGNLIQ